MTDLHTHILPGMDDGAQSVEESIAMLREQARQGVNTVALTPHFYRGKERPSMFLARRAEAWQKLQDALAALPETERESLPKLILGAEVAYAPGMWEWPELADLCYENTKVLLLELPIGQWNEEMFRQIYNLMSHTGITPMLAHVERYFHNRDFGRLFELQLPMQVSAAALLHIFGRKRAAALLMEQEGILISDCHRMKFREPNMEKALRWLEKKEGRRAVKFCIANTDRPLNGGI